MPVLYDLSYSVELDGIQSGLEVSEDLTIRR